MRARYLPLVMLAACGIEAESSPNTLAADVQALQHRMHLRYAAVQRIEQGIVASNPSEVREAAQLIVNLDEPRILPTWQPYVTAVRTAARDVAAADSIVGAARRTGQLGYECGRCHQALGGHVAFRGVPKPDAGIKLQDTMAAHQWGVARMWEGVIGPSDERWVAGAKMLEGAPLTVAAESGKLGIAEDVERVRLLSRRAQILKAPLERAHLFGDLLGTCARCHATIRDNPAVSLH